MVLIMFARLKKFFLYFIEWIEQKIFSVAYRLSPLQEIFLLESVPDLSDNTKAVFDEMIRRGLNKEYKIIWLVKNANEQYPKFENVSYLPLIPKKCKEIKENLKAKLTSNM